MMASCMDIIPGTMGGRREDLSALRGDEKRYPGSYLQIASSSKSRFASFLVDGIWVWT